MADVSNRSTDAIISHLLLCGSCPQKISLSAVEIERLCFESSCIMLKQPMLLELNSPVTVCGDIHGYYTELMRIFDCGGLPPDTNYLFLGDYVDRGKYSLETMCLLLAFKVKYPKKFFLLRGNHECKRTSLIYNFYDECAKKHSFKVWQMFIKAFNCLPVAAVINDSIFCCHGGLSPELDCLAKINKLKRPTNVPHRGLLCDLLWADPTLRKKGWNKSSRGISYTFGVDIIADFLKKNHLALICRAHEMVQGGYEFLGNASLVTVFSVPNYCDHHNNGAIMVVDGGKCTFKVLKCKNTSASLNDEVYVISND